MNPDYKELVEVIKESYNRGYFDHHPDDSEQETDLKNRAYQINFRQHLEQLRLS